MDPRKKFKIKKKKLGWLAFYFFGPASVVEQFRKQLRIERFERPEQWKEK